MCCIYLSSYECVLHGCTILLWQSCSHVSKYCVSLPQVVGHTIQEQGINSACAKQVFRIDVGMSKGCGNGEPEVSIQPDLCQCLMILPQPLSQPYPLTALCLMPKYAIPSVDTINI